MRAMKCTRVLSAPLWWMSAEQFQEDETSWLREQDLQHQIGFDLFWLCGGAGIMPKGGKRGREI